MRQIVFIIGILFSYEIAAHTPAWTIQPSVCIAQKLGDECQFMVTVTTTNMPSELFCLFLNKKLLRCSQKGYFKNRIAITISNKSLIELKNMDQKTILSEELKIKYTYASNKRKRVRSPWSLF